MAFGGSGYGGRILSNINAGTYTPTLAPAASAPVQQAVSTPAGVTPADSGLAAATNTTNAYDEIQRVWAQFGLGSLAPLILQWKQQGYSDDYIDLLAQDTSEYKTRFAANETRRKAGLAVLSPGQYMSLESAYRQILTAAGMPSGFYDQLSDFTDWISKDVAPQEISQRVDYAKRYVANQDPGTKQALRDFYGVGDNELAAYFLDRNKAVPLLEKQAQAIDIGAAAFDQGLSISKDRAEHFADLGAGGNARQAYATVAAALPDATRLSSIYGGDDVTQADLEDEALGGLASAARKRQKLAGQEVASFSEGAGGAKSAFSKKRAGQV